VQHLEDELIKEIKTYIKDHLKLKDDFKRLFDISDIGEKTAFAHLLYFVLIKVSTGPRCPH